MSEEENKLLSAVTDTLLLAVASWGMKESRGLPFASSAFCLYGLRGFFGILNFFGDGEETVKNLYEMMQDFTDVLCFPLFAAQVHSNILDPKSLALSHLLVPALRLLGREVDNGLMVLADLYDCGSIFYYDYLKKNLYYSYLWFIPIIQRYNQTEKDYGKEIVSLVNCIIARTILRGDFPFLHVDL